MVGGDEISARHIPTDPGLDDARSLGLFGRARAKANMGTGKRLCFNLLFRLRAYRSLCLIYAPR